LGDYTINHLSASTKTTTRIGAVDLGSKNFKMVMGQEIGGKVTTELIGKAPLEIGREVTENHSTIGEEKIRQMERTLSRFMLYCADKGAATVLGIATSAIRSARNQQQVIDLALNMGLYLEIADGEREGQVGYLAATEGAPNKLVSGLGSKSMQVVWERDGDIHSQSVSVGYELAYETFVERSASADETRDNFFRFLDGNFTMPPADNDQFIALAANTLTSFVSGEANMIRHHSVLARNALSAFLSKLRQLSPQYDKLKSSLTKTKKTLAGLFFLDYLLERTGLDGLWIAEAELPVGLVVEYFPGGVKLTRACSH
jgi:exopolyphosphatase/pppGpp-phosphohydrolase